MSLQFLYDLAGSISLRDKFSVIALDMIKWNLAELNFIRNELHKKKNFMNLADWD